MTTTGEGQRFVRSTFEIPVDVPLPPEGMVAEDGEPMESEWQRMEIGLLVESVRCHFRPRNDFYAGGNCFVYFNEQQVRNRDYRGPDFFFVWDVSATPIRPYWAIWQEGGRYPNLIVELQSPSTAVEDLTIKKKLYEEVFHTSDYFCYDPVTETLQGWHLGAKGYEPLASNEQGWLWSEVLGLWIGRWQGEYLGYTLTWLRFFTADGTLVKTFSEVEKERADAADAEIARLRAELERRNGGAS